MKYTNYRNRFKSLMIKLIILIIILLMKK